MTFGVNVNHISQGLLSGAYTGGGSSLNIDTKAPAKPIVYNVIDPTTLVNLQNVLFNPKPKVFVGMMKFSITPVDDSRVIILNDPFNNASFSYSDSILINGRDEKYYTMPIIFSKLEVTLTAKYSLCIFGYMFEYSI